MSLSFVSPWLLVGAACIAIPIIIHLILKKKPKHLMFPALRFLQQRRKTNLQKLRLRHLILLALRVLLILVLAVALARPTWIGAPTIVGSDEPLTVVLIFDTSTSMEYVHNGKSRLEHARGLGLKVLDKLPEHSKVAVFDTGAAEEPLASPGEVNAPPVAPPEVQFEEIVDARKIVTNLQHQPMSQPVTTVLKTAFRRVNHKNAPKHPLLLCVFSDRTAASWNNTPLEVKPDRPLNAVYFDLSAPDLKNVAITGLAIRPVSAPLAMPMEDLRFGTTDREEVRIQATVQVTGATVDTQVILFEQGKEIDRQRLRAAAPPGQTVTEIIAFNPMKLQNPFVQGHVGLASNDALPNDNVRYWTLSAPLRQVLILADSAKDADAWRTALETLAPLPLKCDLVEPKDCPAVIPPETYQAVCLLNAAKPTSAKPNGELWKILTHYVSKGGSLLILPGPNCVPAEYASPPALALMPAKLTQQVELKDPKGTFMQPREADFDHPILDRFRAWEKRLEAFRAYIFWDVELIPEKNRVIVPYNYQDQPALIERKFSQEEKVRGSVLLFTTAMFSRNDKGWKDWNNYFRTWFGQGLAYLAMQYSLGLREERTNFLLSDEVTFWLPQGIKLEQYRLRGPGGNQGGVVPKNPDGELIDPFHLTTARVPGSYTLTDAGAKSWVRFFSVNLPVRETDFTTGRPTKEDLEKTLGEGSLQEWKEETDLSDLLRQRLGAPPTLRLIPWLLLGVLLFFILENLLANLFYREAANPAEAAS